MNRSDRCEAATPPTPANPGEIDELAADPLTERHAKPRKESQAARLLEILDGLERSGE